MASKEIKTLFPTGIYSEISDLHVQLQDTDMTCEDMKWRCLEKLSAPHILSDAVDDVLVDIFPAFGLVKADNESAWLPPNHIFKEQNKKQVYKFRLRHRPPSSKVFVENTLLSEFFVLQALDDFLKGELGKEMVKEVPRDTIIELVLLALLLTSSVKLKNSDVIDKRLKIKQFDLFNWHTKFSSEIYNVIITAKNKLIRIVDHYCYRDGIRDSLASRKNQNKTLLFYKEEFVKLLLECYPSYCFEKYSAMESEFYSKVDVKLILYDESTNGTNKQPPGIYIKGIRQCGLEDVDCVAMIPREDDANGRQFEVEINSIGPKENDKGLCFGDEETATSFITMLQGYMTLCIRPDINICYKFTSPSVKVRDDLKSFCPMTHSKALELLKNGNLHKAKTECCGFLIYESLSMNSEDRFQVAINEPDPAGHIKHLNGKGFLFSSLSDPQEFPDHKKLRGHLMKLFGQQLRPDFVSQEIDFKNVFFVKKDFSKLVPLAQTAESYGKAPSYILEEDLGPQFGIIENADDEHILRSIVYFEDDKKVLLKLGPQKPCYVEAMYHGMWKMAKLFRLHPSSVLGFYGSVFACRPSESSYVLEHSSYGHLTEFVSRNKKSLTTQEKMNLAHEVVKIFYTLTQRRESASTPPLLHGNLKGRNFWVFKRHGRIFLKLGDPGLAYYYNTLSLEEHCNDRRIPWLSPERRKSLREVTVSSECYAMATTIAEIFHGTDDFRTVLEKDKDGNAETLVSLERNPVENRKLKDIFSDDFQIPLPNFLTLEDEGLMDSIEEVTTKLWNKLSKCWSPDPSERPPPLELKKYILELEEESSFISEKTSVEHMKAIVLKLYRSENPEEEQKIKEFSSVKMCRTFLNNHMDFFIDQACILQTKQILGQGRFGIVYKGQLVQNETLDVAIKITKGSDLSEEFLDEFKLCAALEHPNIVRAYGWSFRPPDKCYIIMERMGEVNLINYAKTNATSLNDPSTIKTFVKLSLDIANGMEFCANRGVVHSDLAARNVLLQNEKSGNPVAKVSDFGLAKVLDKEKNYFYERWTFFKTLPICWYAPEYLEYAKGGRNSTGINYTKAGDVWAYGTTLWELFSGGKSPVNYFNELKICNCECLYKFYMQDKKRLPQEPYIRSKEIYNIMTECWKQTPEYRPSFSDLKTMISDIFIKC